MNELDPLPHAAQPAASTVISADAAWLAYEALLDATHDGRHGYAQCGACYAARELWRGLARRRGPAAARAPEPLIPPAVAQSILSAASERYVRGGPPFNLHLLIMDETARRLRGVEDAS